MMSPTDLGLSASHCVRVTKPMEVGVSESFEADLEPDTTTVSSTAAGLVVFCV